MNLKMIMLTIVFFVELKKENGEKFCHYCGTEKKVINQDVCLNCGNSLTIKHKSGESPKLRLIALLLALFLGGFGAHRFYVGKCKSAIVMLLTLPITLALTLVGTILRNMFELGYDTSFFSIITGICVIAIPVIIFIDCIRILIGAFTDKNGQTISKWS